MGYEHLKRGAVVMLALLTVIGMTATPVLANDNTATDDCDLVDIDGDNNEVSVNMEDSEVNINCGDGGDAGANGATDDGGDSDDGDEDMTVTVNGGEVDTSEQQDAEQQDEEVQNVEDDAGDQNVEDSAGDQNVEDDAGDQNVESGDGDQNVENDEGDQNVESGDGDQNQESGDGDQATGGDGDDVVQNIDADELVQFFLEQNFIDNDELRAAIANENISNSTIVNNIVNGDQTIDMSSRFVVSSTTIIDNSTTITINDNDITINDNSTNINESGNGSVESGDGDQNVENDDGDQNVGNNGTDDNETDGGDGTDDPASVPDISVTKTTSADEVELDLTQLPGVLRANEPVTFTVIVTNEGDATANDVVVNDEDVIANIEDLPDDATAFVVLNSETNQGEFSAVTGNFTVGTLTPGESATLTFDATAVSSDADVQERGTQIEATNDAELVSVSPDDPNADNDAGSATITLTNLTGISPLDEGASSQSTNNTTATGTDTTETATDTTATATGNESAALGSVPMDLAFGGLGLVGLLGSVLLIRRD